jgi:hypothetical protein
MTTILTVPRYTQPNSRTLLNLIYKDFPDVPVSWEVDPLHKVIHASFSNTLPALVDEVARFYLERHAIKYTVSQR